MTLPPGTAPLTSEQVSTYWDERHRAYGGLQSGGHVGLDDTTNEILYLVRLGRLAELIGFSSDRTAPLDVLDAGCGKGYFARGIARCGHRVDAIDVSPAAIEHCRALGGARYETSTIAAWTSPHLYDVVYSIDVLFHVMDDDEWRAGLRNLASLVRLGGRLLFTDWDLDERRDIARYQVLRSRSEYRGVLEPLGLTHLHFRPDGYRDSGVGFHVFMRTG